MRKEQRNKRVKKESIFRKTLWYHLQNNMKEYLLVFIIFAIGIVLGVIFINKMGEEQKQEVTTYLQDFITKIKTGTTIDTTMLFKQSIQKNIVLGIVLWFVGSTVIGIPFVYLTILSRGFCLGYTISAAIAVLKMGKGLLFFFSSTFLQNILFIPCIIAIAVSGLKFYRAVVKEKESIKQEMKRHTIFSCFCLILLILASFIETYVSTNLLMAVAKYL